MDLNTNGYVANGIYDNIRGANGYSTYDVLNTVDTDRQIQDGIWHTEQKFDDLNNNVHSAEVDTIKAFGDVRTDIGNLRCATMAGFAKIDGDIKLTAEQGKNALLMSQMQTNDKFAQLSAKMDADTISAMRHNDLKASCRNELNASCIFPTAGTCGIPRQNGCNSGCN